MQATLFHDTAARLGEGPLVVGAHLLFFDITQNRLHRIGLDGKGHASTDLGENVSAAAECTDGRLLIASETALLLYDTATGARTNLCALEADNPATRSNDGRADPQGGFWIGTMSKTAEPEAGAIYRYFGGELRCLRDRVTIPNALCFSPDGRTAYFADTHVKRLFRWTLDADGWPVGQPTLVRDFVEMAGAPDGAVTDAEGNVWLAIWGGYRVVRLSPEGEELASVEIDAPNVTCPAFAPDGRVFVTTARQGLSDARLTEYPGSGGVFVFTAPLAGTPNGKVVVT